MATIKVFSAEGVKELNCFDTLLNVPYLDDTEDDIVEDDGELTVGLPLSDEEERVKLTRDNFHSQFPDY